MFSGVVYTKGPSEQILCCICCWSLECLFCTQEGRKQKWVEFFKSSEKVQFEYHTQFCGNLSETVSLSFAYFLRYLLILDTGHKKADGVQFDWKPELYNKIYSLSYSEILRLIVEFKDLIPI